MSEFRWFGVGKPIVEDLDFCAYNVGKSLPWAWDAPKGLPRAVRIVEVTGSNPVKIL